MQRSRPLGRVAEGTAGRAPFKSEPVLSETRPEDVFASLTYDGPPKSLQAMEAGVLAEARRSFCEAPRRR